METQVYTLGRGVLLFKPQGGTGFEEFGNVTDFTVSVKTEVLEHYSTASGLKVKDLEITKSLDYEVKFTIDELRRSTLEKFLLATTQTTSITAGSVTDEAINGVQKGFWYKLSQAKIKRTPAPVVTDDALTPATFIEGVDYEIDYDAGFIYIKPTGNIQNGTNLKVDYSYEAWEKAVMNSGTKYSITGTLWFKGDPPVGRAVDVIGDVSLRPAGELKLIGDSWLEVAFQGTFITKPQIVDRGIRR